MVAIKTVSLIISIVLIAIASIIFYFEYITTINLNPTIKFIENNTEGTINTIELRNNGEKSINDLIVTIKTLSNITNFKKEFGTEDVTLKQIDQNHLEARAPRLAPGNGSIININIFSDSKQIIMVYVTYDGGSVFETNANDVERWFIWNSAYGLPVLLYATAIASFIIYLFYRMKNSFKKSKEKNIFQNTQNKKSEKMSKIKMSKIITDDIEDEPITPDEKFDFKKASNTIANIIRDSNPKYSIGIFGEWGTGKTTLMRMVEKNLLPEIFCWEDIPQNLEKQQQLKNHLIQIRQNFPLPDWLDNEIVFKKKSSEIEILEKSTNLFHRHSLLLTLEDGKVFLKHNGKILYRFLITEDKNNSHYIIRDNSILTVWFNAWRYESEEHFALIPLLKTIAYAMEEHPIYKDLEGKFLRALAILGKDVIRHLALEYISTEKGITELETNFENSLGKSMEFEKKLIYFEGMKKIEDEMKNIRKSYPDTRIVVFVDDLDRCSPENALEVFESIKVFLDIEGFVFVLGLSREALEKLILAKFQKIGLAGVTPEQYIRKIIQIEIQLPSWYRKSLEDLIHKMISENLNEKYKTLITDKAINLMLDAAELNPRDIKRLLNKFLILLSVFALDNEQKSDNKNLQKDSPMIYLAGEALRKKYKKVYEHYIIGDSSFSEQLDHWLKWTPKERKEYISNPNPMKYDKYQQIASDFRFEFTDDNFWKFYGDYREYLMDIDTYKRISNLTNVIINTPIRTEDNELHVRRIVAYTHLWRRFRLISSDIINDSLLPDIREYEGRHPVNSIENSETFLVRCQSWYYDWSGGMLMPEKTHQSFMSLCTEIKQAVGTPQQQSTNTNKKIKKGILEDEIYSKIKLRVRELQENMLRDIGRLPF